MTATHLPAIAAITFRSDKTAITHLQAAGHARRATEETTSSLARDITNAAVETVLGPRPARHRKETRR